MNEPTAIGIVKPGSVTQLQSASSDNGKEKRLLNLRPFPKGVSGNPGGRPKGDGVTGAIRRLVAEGNTSDQIASVIVANALKGDIDFLKVLLDRTAGSVLKRVQSCDERTVDELTDAELMAIVVTGKRLGGELSP